MLGPTAAHLEQAGPAPFGPSGRFAWRVILVQLAADALVIAVLILVLPGFELHSSHKLLSVVWLAVLFGLVTALVRPALEFILLPYVLQTLGLVHGRDQRVLLALLALTSALEIRGVGALAVGAVARRRRRLLPRQRARSDAAGAWTTTSGGAVARQTRRQASRASPSGCV